jgi:hypothetical protein
MPRQGARIAEEPPLVHGSSNGPNDSRSLGDNLTELHVFVLDIRVVDVECRPQLSVLVHGVVAKFVSDRALAALYVLPRRMGFDFPQADRGGTHVINQSPYLTP